jgi:hypothetical protein
MNRSASSIVPSVQLSFQGVSSWRIRLLEIDCVDCCEQWLLNVWNSDRSIGMSVTKSGCNWAANKIQSSDLEPIIISDGTRTRHNIIVPPTSRSSSWSLSSWMSHQNPICVHFLPVLATFLPNLTLLILNILIILGKEYRLWSSSLCTFLQLPITSSLFDPNMLSSKIPSFCAPPLMPQIKFYTTRKYRQEDKRFWTEWGKHYSNSVSSQFPPESNFDLLLLWDVVALDTH